MRKLLAIIAAVGTALGSTAFAAEQESSLLPRSIEFEERRWACDSVDKVTVEEYRGKTALHLYGGSGDSLYLPDVEFQDGVIEVDFAVLDRSVPGIGFRGRESGKWRNQILFNHWLGKDQGEGGLEQAILTRRDGTILILNVRGPGQDCGRDSRDARDWFHAKVVVKGDNVKVYLDRSEEPSIEVGAVFDANSRGELGLCVVGGGGLYFANFRYTTAE